MGGYKVLHPRDDGASLARALAAIAVPLVLLVTGASVSAANDSEGSGMTLAAASQAGVLLVQGSYGSYRLENADGSYAQNLEDLPSRITDPSLSPDLKTIVYSLDWTIYQLAVSGGSPQVWATPRASQNETRFSHPTWSPDGSKIAFVCGDSRAESWQKHICIAPAGDPTNRTRFAFGEYAEFDSDRYVTQVERLSWSPDGTQVAASLRTLYGDALIGIADLATQQQRWLDGAGNRWTGGVAWGPEGFAYNLRNDIRRLDALTLADENLTSFAEWQDPQIGAPHWSPDGTTVAYGCSLLVEASVGLERKQSVCLTARDQSQTILMTRQPGMACYSCTVHDWKPGRLTAPRPTPVVTVPPTTTPAPTSGTDRDGFFTPVGPVRVFDTRGEPFWVEPDNVYRYRVTGRNRVPSSGVAAVSLNLTATRGWESGYVTVWPCSRTRPASSNLNFSAGESVANGVLAPVGSDGWLCFWSSQPVDLIADLNGWMASGAGFTAVGPTRSYDSRADGGPRRAHQVTVLGKSGVPSRQVSAVALNVTALNASSPGYVTVYACGSRRPDTSSLNFEVGQVAANSVIAPVTSTGAVCIDASVPANVIVDISGWFATDGGFTSVGPHRLLDSRGGPMYAKTWYEALQVSGRFRVPSAGVAAAALNITAVGARRAGYVTVWPCDAPEPEASSVNFVPGRPVPNGVVAPISASGEICYVASEPVDLLVDISGWFAQ